MALDRLIRWVRWATWRTWLRCIAGQDVLLGLDGLYVFGALVR